MLHVAIVSPSRVSRLERLGATRRGLGGLLVVLGCEQRYCPLLNKAVAYVRKITARYYNRQVRASFMHHL